MNRHDTNSAPILLLGADGQVGWELRRSLANLGPVIALTRDTLDLENLVALRGFVRATAPRLIVNAAAYTAVDRAQEESVRAEVLNAAVPRVLAEEAVRSGSALVHYSTDYVFAGDGVRPYREDDATGPINTYGATKLAGELAITASGAAALIFRTSWVYGTRGRNFLLTIKRLAAQQDRLRVVDDQLGAPTWSRNIADATAHIVARGWPDMAGYCAEHRGLYHLSCGGSTSWHQFAASIVAHLHGASERAVIVEPIKTEDYPTPARRPAYSVLDCQRLQRVFGIQLPPWEYALTLALGA
jgi:dTDP-4-dehydrorhamnose reductase